MGRATPIGLLCLYSALELLHTWNANMIRQYPSEWPVARDAVDMVMHAALQTTATSLCLGQALPRSRMVVLFFSRIAVEYLVYTYAFADAFYGRRDDPQGDLSTVLSPLGVVGVGVYIAFEEAAARVALLGLRGVKSHLFANPVLGSYHFVYIMIASAYLSMKRDAFFWLAHGIRCFIFIAQRLLARALLFTAKCPCADVLQA